MRVPVKFPLRVAARVPVRARLKGCYQGSFIAPARARSTRKKDFSKGSLIRNPPRVSMKDLGLRGFAMRAVKR